MKLTQNILAMYLGCPLQTDTKNAWTLTAIDYLLDQIEIDVDNSGRREVIKIADLDRYKVKPILRKLEDMTEEERVKEYFPTFGERDINGGEYTESFETPQTFAWLLSKS